MEGMMSRSGDSEGARRPRKRRSLIMWLARKLVISFVFMSLLSLVGVGYMAHRNRTLIEEALRGLDTVADKLEQNDRDSAAERLRELRTKLESLNERSGEYSEKVRLVLGRIREKSEDLYREAKEAIDGSGEKDAGDAGTGTDAPADDTLSE
jgi:hypothetical protein